VSAMTVLLMPESAYGPTNNCIGIGRVLQRRGHRVVFAAETSWKGKLAALGFEEALVDLAPPAADPEAQDAGQFWKDFIRDTAQEFRRPTIEQLETFMASTWQALIDGARFCEPQLRNIIAGVKPDLVVQDNVVCFPALMTAGVPYVRIVSCNPLEVPGPDVPPPYSGLGSDDRIAWTAFRKEYERTHRPVWEPFNAWVQEQGAPPLPDLEFIHTSAVTNLYVYPEMIDYIDRRPLDTTWHRVDASVRETDGTFDLPAEMRGRYNGSALIYLSLGSLGSADVDLMRRLIDVLGRT
jgi:UDP:flavonoid glycosyltransferase YjiC (YdhE family)